MIPSAVLGRYAKTLADVVFEENLEQEVTGNLETYNEIFQAVPDVLNIFDRQVGIQPKMGIHFSGVIAPNLARGWLPGG